PSHTVGGGRVIEVNPPRHRRFRPEVGAALEALARGRPADLLLRALDDGQPHEWAALLKATGLPPGAAADALKELLGEEKVVALEVGEVGSGSRAVGGSSIHSPTPLLPYSRSWVISTKGWDTLREKLTTALRGYQRRYPLRAGMPREELRSRLNLSGDALDAVLAFAEAQGHLARRETTVALPEWKPALAPEQERVVRRFLEAYHAAPYSPPAPDVEPELLGWLLEQGQIIRVAPDVAFLPQIYAEMIGWV